MPRPRACSFALRRLASASATTVLALCSATSGVADTTRAAASETDAPGASRIATNVERSYSPPAEALLRKAYGSLGLQVEFLAWTLARTQVELRHGRLDAVAMRADAFFDHAPFVRKVDVPLLRMAEIPVDTRHGTLCRVPTPLSRTTLFHGVHESRAAWVAPLEQALRTMRQRGEIQQAWEDYERQTSVQANRLQAEPGRSLAVKPVTQEAPASAPARPQQ